MLCGHYLNYNVAQTIEDDAWPSPYEWQKDFLFHLVCDVCSKAVTRPFSAYAVYLFHGWSNWVSQESNPQPMVKDDCRNFLKDSSLVSFQKNSMKTLCVQFDDVPEVRVYERDEEEPIPEHKCYWELTTEWKEAHPELQTIPIASPIASPVVGEIVQFQSSELGTLTLIAYDVWACIQMLCTQSTSLRENLKGTGTAVVTKVQ